MHQNKYRYVQPVSFKDAVAQVFKRPLPHQVAGDLMLGNVVNTSTAVCLLLEELVQHILIVGRSGTGKTNVMRIIQLGLVELGIPFLAFDLAKYGTRYTKQYIQDLILLRWYKEFFLNPLKPPPNVRLIEWLLIFCEITSEIFGLMAASKSLLIEVVRALYDQFQTDTTGIVPTIHDLDSALARLRVKTKSYVHIDYIDRLRNKTTAMCIALNDQLNVQEGIPIHDLLQYPVCIELVGLNMSEIQAWIVAMIMAWISSYRSANTHLGEFKHMILFDEAAQIFFARKNTDKPSSLVSYLRRLREYSEGIVMADQSISSLDHVAKANVHTIVCLGQRDVEDMNEVIGIM